MPVTVVVPALALHSLLGPSLRSVVAVRQCLLCPPAPLPPWPRLPFRPLLFPPQLLPRPPRLLLPPRLPRLLHRFPRWMPRSLRWLLLGLTGSLLPCGLLAGCARSRSLSGCPLFYGHAASILLITCVSCSNVCLMNPLSVSLLSASLLFYHLLSDLLLGVHMAPRSLPCSLSCCGSPWTWAVNGVVVGRR